MVELDNKKRIKFPNGKQGEFIKKLERQLSVKEMAKLCDRSERTIRDWRREKFLIDSKSLKTLCKKTNTSIPENMQIKDQYWYVLLGAVSGGQATKKKYGKPVVDEVYRKQKWHEWWESKGQYNKKWIVRSAPLKIEKPAKSEKLAEFVGIVLGDGCISNNQLTITLHRKDDADYAKFVTQLIQKLFNVPVGIYKNKHALANSYVISRVELVRFCVNKLGLKIGHKVKQQVDVPDWIKNDISFSVACLRGLVDTDGSIFTHRYKVAGKYYKYKKLAFNNSSEPLVIFANQLLTELNITNRTAQKGKEVRIDSVSDMKKYFKLVGSNNPKHLKKYAN